MEEGGRDAQTSWDK